MDKNTIKIQRALISVSDKTGLIDLGRALAIRRIEILSSGGTAKALREADIPVQEVSDFTGAPEMLDGRLKTLHPKIHGGILAIRSNAEHMEQLSKQKYVPIDLVVVNLYPFEATAQKEGLPFEEVVEQVDIGGPTLLRAAAKNHPCVAALVEPSQYDDLLAEMDSNQGATTLEFRRTCARRVFERTAAYDATIAQVFQGPSEAPPTHYPMGLELKWEMRYGENPHQNGGFYLPAAAQGKTVLERVLQGKQLSYNNLLDIHGALDLMGEFAGNYAVAILKHTNPCGVGVAGDSLLTAYERALACDPVSAFGGIVVFSHPLDGKTAEVASQTFTEIVIAPSFEPEAMEIFAKKKNVRLVEVDLAATKKAMKGFDVRRIVDGYLVQARDLSMEDLRQANVATKRKPTDSELKALALAWRVAKHVKSNAIVLANETETLGIGAGQMSRVDSMKIAALKAKGEKLRGCVMASDAFFPFRDSVDEAAKVGVKAIVQPGGSIRDEEVIAAADHHGIAMVLTGVRHFRH